MTDIAFLSEGLPGDLRPLCYSRSTWDMPFLGRPLLAVALEWLERTGCRHVFVLDDTPGLWLAELAARCPVSVPMQHVDARRGAHAPETTLDGLLDPLDAARVRHLKPCALVEPDWAGLEAFHASTEAEATFALTRLDPGALGWPFIPACRMDEMGGILEVDKLRRTDTLGTATFENVLGASAPSRPREFWAPRNVAILDIDLARRLPLAELLAPLAGLARKLAADGVACYGRAMKGRWWPASSTAEVMAANREAVTQSGGVVSPSARVAPDAVVERSVVAGGVELGEGAHVVGSVLVEGVHAGARSSVRDCLLGPAAGVPEDMPLSGAVMADGEVQNLLRGIPPGGQFIDGTRHVDEAGVVAYWREHLPMRGRRRTASVLHTLARGLDNNVYHIFDGRHHFVLKRRLDSNANPLIREFHVLRAVQARGFAPRPYIVDLRPEVPLAPCIVMEYVRGERVPERGITVDTARAIARTCQQVHEVPVDGLLRDLPELGEQSFADLRTYVDDLVFQYNSWLESRQPDGRADDPLDAQVTRVVAWMQALVERENVHWSGYVPRVLCQGDLREFNMLVCDGGEIRLLDWERCGIDDPAYDVGWFLALAEMTPEAEQAFRDAYGPGLPGDKSFWQRVDAFRAADVLTWPIHLLGLSADVRERRVAATDPEKQAASYESDACRALARAFDLVSGGATSHDEASVRALGSLFGA